MDPTSVTSRLARYFWPGVCIVFFFVYALCNTYSVTLPRPPHNRRVKHQPRDSRLYLTTVDVEVAARGLSGSRPTNFTSGYAEEWRDNIVYPQVDVSEFPPIDTSLCASMREDIEIAPPHSMPLIALASFPRSGNTWSRSLIQIATRYSTGSVHWETERNLPRVKEWFKAGGEDFMLKKGVCVKTHFYGRQHVSIFEDGAILLLRNPYYSLASEFLRFHGVIGNATKEDIVTMMNSGDERWTKDFLPTYEKWKNTALSWITQCERLMIVFYEDLERNTVYELTRMVAFLGQPIQPQRILCAVQSFSPMQGRKNHTSQMNFDPYTPELHELLDGYIGEVNRTLIKKHAVPLPTYEKYFHAT